METYIFLWHHVAEIMMNEGQSGTITFGLNFFYVFSSFLFLIKTAVRLLELSINNKIILGWLGCGFNYLFSGFGETKSRYFCFFSAENLYLST